MYYFSIANGVEGRERLEEDRGGKDTQTDRQREKGQKKDRERLAETVSTFVAYISSPKTISVHKHFSRF